METKQCQRCKQHLPLSMYGKLSSSKDGFNYRCKPCANQANKESAARNPDRLATSKRNSWLQRNYGIDNDEYDRMVREQDDKCGCCGTADKGTNRSYWCVDHDHQTGVVRGLLCATCNKSIGQLGDTVEALERALAYLKKTYN